MQVTNTLSESPTRVRQAVAGAVRVELARRNMTQTALARAAGLTGQYLSRRMTGETPFTVDDLATIAQALDVDMATLITGDRPVCRAVAA